MISAKKNFQQSPHAKVWADTIASDWFQSAVQAAMLDMDFGRSVNTDQAAAAALHYKREGALDFVKAMYGLVDKPQDPVRPSMPPNLKPVK